MRLVRADLGAGLRAGCFDLVVSNPPYLTEASQRQRAALLRALGPVTEGWSDADRKVAAAMLDVLWGVAPYERLVTDWQLDSEQATAGITWVIRLVEEAVRDGRVPTTLMSY